MGLSSVTARASLKVSQSSLLLPESLVLLTLHSKRLAAKADVIIAARQGLAVKTQ